MTIPRLELLSPASLDDSAPLVVVGARSRDGEIAAVVPDALEALIGELSPRLADVGFSGGRDELVRLPGLGGVPPLAVVGLPGAADDLGALRYAAGTAVRQLAGTPDVVLALPVDGDAAAEAVLEGAALGAYAFRDYRSGATAPVGSVVVAADVDDDEGVLERVKAVAEAVSLVKDLVNTPSNDLYPETFAAAASSAVADLGVDVLELEGAALVEGGYGGILGVGMGSARPPRLVRLDWAPEDARAHVALVGKGITFDSGGLSLKPPLSMIGMKYDMTGAATVLGVVAAAARLRVPVRVTGWLCLAENMPSGSAVRPGDVLTIHGGTTVEVLNTDAEGRLVLADGLVAASEEQPDALIDVATLTGAALVALGTRYSAVMGDPTLVGRVVTAIDGTGEQAWAMPLAAELRRSLDSDTADLANAAPGSTAGGMMLAGVFLSEFVGRREDGERIPWAHLDIAGTAKAPASPYGWSGKGATGVVVRGLISLIEGYGAA